MSFFRGYCVMGALHGPPPCKEWTLLCSRAFLKQRFRHQVVLTISWVPRATTQASNTPTTDKLVVVKEGRRRSLGTSWSALLGHPGARMDITTFQGQGHYKLPSSEYRLTSH